MIIGVFPEQGGSITSYNRSGQDKRFVDNYLGRYSRNFEKVYFFSYADENPELPEFCELLPNKWKLHRWLYAVMMPFIYLKKLKTCSLVRLMQATGEIPAVIAKILFRIPVVATFGYRYSLHSRLDGEFIRPFVFKLRERIALSLCDSVIVTADSMYNYIRKHVSEDKILFVPNGVDTKLFTPAERETTDGVKTVISVGGLRRQKNQRLLIKALSLIKGKVKLKLIGEGPLKKELQIYAGEHGVEVEFLGVLKHEDLPQYLNSADVFVLSSYSEGHPKALLEAMSCGLPCIGTNIPGIKDVITDGENGVLCDLNANDFAEKISFVLREKQFAFNLGKNAREYVTEKYELDDLINREIEHFKHIIVRRSNKTGVLNIVKKLKTVHGWRDFKNRVFEKTANRLWSIFTGRGRATAALVKRRKKTVSSLMALPFPDTLHIELTNRCNLRCSMCSYSQMRREKMDMDIEAFKRVIDQCCGRSVDTISLYYFGEALLYNKLEEAISYIGEKLPSVHTRIRTNAQLLDIDKARNLLESSLTSLEFSVDGLTKPDYERIMKGADYECMQDNLNNYFSLRRQMGKTQQNMIVTIAMEETEAELDAFVRYWSQFCTVNITRHHEGFLTAEAVERKGGDVKRLIPCPEVFYHAMILSNGEVSFCCCDVEGSLSIGNVKNAALCDIWNSEKAYELRTMHSKTDFSSLKICAGCSGGILREGIVRR